NWWSWPVVLGWAAFLAIASAIGIARANKAPDLRAIARRVEESHPDLQAALLAAMDEKSEPGAELSFLQRRLMADISEHAVKNQWVRQVSSKRLAMTGWGQLASLVGFALSIWFLLGQAPGAGNIAQLDPGNPMAIPEVRPDVAVSILPGDVEIEKGSRLVVEANFQNRAPATAMLVVTDADGERRIPMEVGLDDSVFSALLPKVVLDGTYEVRYESESSDEYSIDVFEFPILVQSDALITPPAYLNREPEEKLDTQKITVMEDSRVDWKVRVNKPLAAAELFGEDQVSIPLSPDPDDPTLYTATHTPLESQKYRLHLVDEDDRSNKRPPWFTVNVKRNEPPELKLTFPGRDFEVSAVQELPIEGEAWDDVQIERIGFAYQLGEEETEIVLTDSKMAGEKTHPLSTFIDVEALGAEPKDLITYYLWAEDLDREGQLRRTTSDMFFAEVRFFEEIIREGQPGTGQGGEQQGQAGRLLELQKDVINAAWKLRRHHELNRPFESIAGDLDVVQESQLVVLSMVDPILAEVDDPELKAIYEQAKVLMEQASDEFLLVAKERDGDLLAPAHQTARAVFAKLLEARERESEIALQQQPSQGSNDQRRQMNLNLELEQNQLKYEEKSQAQMEQESAEQQENLAVLNRLKELARRQEAIAEKIKELEQAMQDALNEEERTEIERQLKRLQEEQRELLREADDLAERMDSEQNRANMSEERSQLEETRENIQDAAENLESGDLADAANSATRAQEELEQMEEEFRERTSRKFAEEMRGLREKARELEANQEGISETLNELADTSSNDSLSTESQLKRSQLAQEISEQANLLNELVEEMKTLSEQAEPSEPILSDSLYDAVRKTMMNGVEESLEEARDYTFYNRPGQALEPQEAATRGIEELRENVEAAAEKVLGNEADALRLARSELDRLIEESRQEAQELAESSGQQGKHPDQQGTAARPGSGPRDENRKDGPGVSLAENQNRGKSKSQGMSPSDAESDRSGQNEGSQSGEGQEGEPGQEEAQGSQSGEGEGQGEESLAENSSGQPGQGQGEQPGESGAEGDQPGEDQGEQPGEGQGEGSLAENSSQPGQGQQPGEGPGEGPGEQPGQGQGQGEGQQQSAQTAQANGQGRQPGQGSEEGSQQAGTPGSRENGGGSLSMGGDDRGSSLPTGNGKTATPLFFNQPSEQRRSGPITGEGYEEFRDRLGNIEEMVPQEDLRNQIARVGDNAREMRIDFSRDNLPPEAAAIDQRITQPLLELRQRLSEEIAKLNRENPIAPVDRDPVPSEFRDLVRRYYEELGSGN
ncbi:MAG: hypothetical protein AAF733_00315, partial [Verrucomicrobiota bacterium]